MRLEPSWVKITEIFRASCLWNGDCRQIHSTRKGPRAAADLTKLPEEIVRSAKTPAGRATSPSLLAGILDQLKPFQESISEKYSDFAGGLRNQEDIITGLGLFDAFILTTEVLSNLKKVLMIYLMRCLHNDAPRYYRETRIKKRRNQGLVFQKE